MHPRWFEHLFLVQPFEILCGSQMELDDGDPVGSSEVKYVLVRFVRHDDLDDGGQSSFRVQEKNIGAKKTEIRFEVDTCRVLNQISIVLVMARRT